MDPISAAISVGGSLLGGLFGSNAAKAQAKQERKWALEDQREQFVRLRAAAEKGGFNPLTALGANPTGGMPRATAAASGDYMGKAVAESALMLADSYARTAGMKREAKLQQVAQERDKLQAKLTAATIRPTMPGIYGNGGRDGRAASSVARDVSQNSPFAGAVVGPDDGNLTGPQHSVKKDVPAFRLFGHDFYGSGLFSTAQQVEDSIGESEIVSALYAPIVLADALANESFKAGRDYSSRRWKQKLIESYKPQSPAVPRDWWKQQFGFVQ